ncbi:hypothetical protein GGF42_005794 [Coemansia sp. RSA 2424]|nr:hypothetical protein GGF42_005794 [Coemansia sp. RSA 2424]
MRSDGEYNGTLADFKTGLINEFTKHDDVAYAELELAKLRQKKTVREYTDKFQEIAGRIPRMLPEDRRRWYQNGLSDKVRVAIMSGRYTTYDAVRTAALAQDVLGSMPEARSTPTAPAPNPNAMDVDAMQAPRLNRLSPADRDSARAAGLCFKCRQPGHISRYCPSGRQQQQYGQRRGHHVHNMEWPAYSPMPYYPPYYAPYMGYPPGFGPPGPQAPEQQQQQQQSPVFQPRQ